MPVAVEVGVPVVVEVGVPVEVAVVVEVGVAVAVEVAVEVGVGVPVAVAVEIEVEVAVEVGVLADEVVVDVVCVEPGRRRWRSRRRAERLAAVMRRAADVGRRVRPDAAPRCCLVTGRDAAWVSARAAAGPARAHAAIAASASPRPHRRRHREATVRAPRPVPCRVPPCGRYSAAAPDCVPTERRAWTEDVKATDADRRRDSATAERSRH